MHSPPSIESLITLGSKASTGNASWPRLDEKKDHRRAFSEFSTKDSGVADAARQTADMIPCE
ncbi:hypothetical protein PHLCEN_2v6583 [Hermanssonia centrifuga]|uniref:Uncharacterized protein n=1 Tax=Hermanssonia centrifuga TaxID=98765 RepID=A0A2R6NZ00_9APHY|nr:hypothetical protein PHLCEN_2v6583 [Hermanssonia centrifuga]